MMTKAMGAGCCEGGTNVVRVCVHNRYARCLVRVDLQCLQVCITDGLISGPSVLFGGHAAQ